MEASFSFLPEKAWNGLSFRQQTRPGFYLYHFSVPVCAYTSCQHAHNIILPDQLLYKTHIFTAHGTALWVLPVNPFTVYVC